jgi:hypothetical protein
MQEENKIAQLIFLNKTNFLSISKTLAFLFGQENLISENHTRPTSLSPSSDQGDKRRPSHVWLCLKDWANGVFTQSDIY